LWAGGDLGRKDLLPFSDENNFSLGTSLEESKMIFLANIHWLGSLLWKKAKMGSSRENSSVDFKERAGTSQVISAYLKRDLCPTQEQKAS